LQTHCDPVKKKSAHEGIRLAAQAVLRFKRERARKS
jgi:hypothetical protein